MKRQRRRWWMLSVHRDRSKESMEGQFALLLREPSGEFSNFVRMSFTDFEWLQQQISPKIQKMDTTYRECIQAKVRLAVTLRYLATGDSFRSLHSLFKISPASICHIVMDVCLAINETLRDMVSLPATPEEWLLKSKGFRFPHCLGALDGKHIKVLCPPNSGSDYFNCKGDFSIVLLALVDSNYCFTFADIGSKGRISDGGVFAQSVLWKKIAGGSANLPPPAPLPNSSNNFPYVFLADGAFPLHGNVMKPFPGTHEKGSPERIFNSHLSASRVFVENTFGIFASVFRVFGKPITLKLESASVITMTCVLLHNFLRSSKTSREIYTPIGSLDTYDANFELTQPGSWRQHGNTFTPLQNIPRRGNNGAIETRLQFRNYLYQKMIMPSREKERD